MLPSEQESVYIDPALLQETTPKPTTITRPAQHLEQSKLLGMTIGLLGLAYLGYYFFIAGGNLNLNSVIAVFLFLAITLHQTPHNLLNSLQQAIPSGAGIVIQFPFYAGIMTVMVDSGLAQQISRGFIAVADADSLPFFSFISAGLVNMFVPSCAAGITMGACTAHWPPA